jgi:TonB family protein
MNVTERSALCLTLCLTLLVGFSVGQAQDRNNNQAEECPGPIYRSGEVTVRAKITHMDEPQYTEEARKNGVQGRVVLRAVLCATGKVTNIEVLKSLPYGLTEKAIKTMPMIKFRPAEKDGKEVSQYIMREFNFMLF